MLVPGWLICHVLLANTLMTRAAIVAIPVLMRGAVWYATIPNVLVFAGHWSVVPTAN